MKRAARLLLAAALAAPTAAQAPGAPGAPVEPGAPSEPGAPGEQVLVSFTCTPSEVEIGQPIACSLRVEHPARARVTLVEDEAGPLFADPGGSQHAVPWLVVDGPERRVTPLDPADPEGRLATELHWSALALEPGARSPGAARVEVELDERVLSRSARAADVTVRAALAEGEDAPRPPSAFPEAPAPLRGSGVLLALAAWALVVSGLCLAALVAFVRGRRRPARAAEPGPDERLAAFERELALGFERGGEALERSVRAFTYGASALLREAVDRRLGAPSPAATDEEWLARLERDARVEPRLASDLRRFLGALEPIEYGSERPTRFAFEELAQRARGLCARIGDEVRAPASAAVRERAA